MAHYYLYNNKVSRGKAIPIAFGRGHAVYRVALYRIYLKRPRAHNVICCCGKLTVNF